MLLKYGNEISKADASFFYLLFFLSPNDFMYLCQKSEDKLHLGIKNE